MKTKKVRKKKVKQVVELRFVSDPRHGWMEVPSGLLRTVGYNLEDVSAWVGDTCFLEEDCEVTMFLDQCKKHGFEVKTNDIEVDDFDKWIEKHPAQWVESGQPCGWPGPTRLYDAEVEVGAPLLCKSQAEVLVMAAGFVMGGKTLGNSTQDRIIKNKLIGACEVLNFTFGLGVERVGGRG